MAEGPAHDAGRRKSLGIGIVGSPQSGAEMDPTCPERERLLREWMERSKSLRKLQDKQFVAFRNTDPGLATFDEKIRLARATDVQACRAYYNHVARHGCV